MNVQTAYNSWADTYDEVLNKTRDLEAVAIRQLLADVAFADVVEIGCGTGKNTEWLATKAARVTAVDFSAEMLAKARAKLGDGKIRFQQADITQPWSWVETPVDGVTCSLILEHIENLSFVFRQCHAALKPNGFFYIGELHPFKQCLGSKARFETGAGEVELTCFTHHVSDYIAAAHAQGFRCVALRECFDDDGTAAVPRILGLLFRKQP
jgi:2-polyprenyl-3-methyl-5-hydroxy-6-metoxy-1,4-benzoquinol methylase